MSWGLERKERWAASVSQALGDWVQEAEEPLWHFQALGPFGPSWTSFAHSSQAEWLWVMVRQYWGINAGGYYISMLTWHLRPWSRDVGSVGETWELRVFNLVLMQPVEGKVAGAMVSSWFSWCLSGPSKLAYCPQELFLKWLQVKVSPGTQ